MQIAYCYVTRRSVAFALFATFGTTGTPRAIGGLIKQARFWDAERSRKSAVFTFSSPSHNRIHITKYFFPTWETIVSQHAKCSLKKGEFSKFLISRSSDKAFQELSFKKNSTKKYSFSAKLLDVEVYYTLIVSITRWQVLSFWGNLSRNKSQGLSRNTCRKIGWRSRTSSQVPNGSLLYLYLQ